MAKEILLTHQGIEEAKIELKYLLDEVRPKVIEELVEARNQGDLSENADYDAARKRQAEVEARIKELENMIDKAIIIEDVETDNVQLGSKVELQMLNTKEKLGVKIVGSTEADPFKGYISNESPIAKAIWNKKVGDIVDVKSVDKPYSVKILDIK
ncbi:transcription elongation factor GreA [Entomoplasma ellychniae]|uniref:Transcription elongation factor GreA n=2 Tax=Entomoplasmataceae TaxID=33925 RepID=A0A2S5RGZ9_9MOLU|nr:MULTISPECIES: transcription elongation factor GreA [Entomoplasmataceae]PPE04878.1 transcription elongation factor GreA [Entomoplasma ellychniae]PPE06583.1 transcription elongation factor GreA [Mesoplasma corruscae]